MGRHLGSGHCHGNSKKGAIIAVLLLLPIWLLLLSLLIQSFLGLFHSEVVTALNVTTINFIRDEGKCMSHNISDSNSSNMINNSTILNITDQVLCFIHIGKTAGASFRNQFAGGRRFATHPESLPSLKEWNEIHTNTRTKVMKKSKCDYYIAWVRDPVDRGVSAYNMILDPSWTNEVRARGGSAMFNALIDQQHHLSRFTSLNNLTEQLFTNEEAFDLWESIEHVKHDITWYFTLNGTTGNPTDPGKEAHFGAVGLLHDPNFVERLVFVGANECYKEDVERFTKLFGVPRVFMEKRPIVHSRQRHPNSFDSKNLSSLARLNIQHYFEDDYEVLRSLSRLGLIKCKNLLDRICK